MDTSDTGRRRSLRRREEKSYAETPELIYDDDSSSPNSPTKGTTGKSLHNPIPSVKDLAKNDHHVTTNNTISNGDVEMESDEESDDGAPLPPLPLPKVGLKQTHPNRLSN